MQGLGTVVRLFVWLFCGHFRSLFAGGMHLRTHYHLSVMLDWGGGNLITLLTQLSESNATSRATYFNHTLFGLLPFMRLCLPLSAFKSPRHHLTLHLHPSLANTS
uniref:Putative secreted protein n=1 Tax=Anopheles triannulatus TaxID=58253 RepID=A0A2M4B6I8_9DIPT